MDTTRTQWAGRAFLRPGRLMYVGSIGPTALHAHHALQIVMGLSGAIPLIDEAGGMVLATAAVIPPDTLHATGAAGQGLMLYIDLEANAGRWLPAAVPESRTAASWVEAACTLRDHSFTAPVSLDQAVRTEDRLLKLLAYASPFSASGHLPAVEHAVRAIESALSGTLSLGSVANAVGISPRSLSQMFVRQVGIPFRRYVLWRRIMAAVQHISDGSSWTEAAHAAGFTDSAHLNRVFWRMFGLAPSTAVRHIEWFIAPGLIA